MANSITIAQPETVCLAVRTGIFLARAWREYLGYSIEDIAKASCLTLTTSK